MKLSSMIAIKTKEEIDSMRRGGKILAQIMNELEKNIFSGNNSGELDKLAERLVFANDGRPAFKGQGEKSNPYAFTICCSLNNEVVHGLPSPKTIFQEGDIVKVDIGMEYEGLITDMTRTFEVGKVSPEAHGLIKATGEALNEGIGKIKSGAKLSEYSAAVESFVRSQGFSVVRDLVGHGVGRVLHEDPQIPNYKWGAKDVTLREGMTLALEPMVNEGDWKVKLASDGWTYVTADGKLSAQFEDTVLVRKGGCEILTR